MIFRFAIPGNQPREFSLVESREACEINSPEFAVGDTIQVSTKEDNFMCSITGKVFKDEEGNPIRSTVSGRGREREELD